MAGSFFTSRTLSKHPAPGRQGQWFSKYRWSSCCPPCQGYFWSCTAWEGRDCQWQSWEPITHIVARCAITCLVTSWPWYLIHLCWGGAVAREGWFGRSDWNSSWRYSVGSWQGERVVKRPTGGGITSWAGAIKHCVPQWFISDWTLLTFLRGS